MSAQAILLAMAIVGAVGLIIGFFLCIASEKLAVEVDEKEVAVLEALPGNNCGACGFPGCSGLAAAIAKGEAAVNQCPVGGAPVGEVISQIMGVAMEDSEKMVAYVKCNGNFNDANRAYKYSGVEDCIAMAFVPGGGEKLCKKGCHGFGSCVKVCEFDAIHIVNGVAVVDKEKCTSCKRCIDICPQNLIELIPYNATEAVRCSNTEKGKAVMEACDVGCIACKLCEKNCPCDAIFVEDNVAHIDQEKCTGCGACAEKCPKHCIEILNKPASGTMAS